MIWFTRSRRCLGNASFYCALLLVVLVSKDATPGEMDADLMKLQGDWIIVSVKTGDPEDDPSQVGRLCKASAYQTRFRHRTWVRKAVLIMHDFILPLRLSLAG